MIRWKDTDYYVTIDGKIWSEKSQKFLKPQKHKKGYLSVSLRYDNKTHTELVHIMVAKCYIPNPDNKPIINHKDCNKHNPHSNNLEWSTQLENSRHASANGLLNIKTSCGSTNGNATKVEYFDGNNWIKFDTVVQASQALNISRPAISRCLIGRSKTCAGYKWRYTTI